VPALRTIVVGSLAFLAGFMLPVAVMLVTAGPPGATGVEPGAGSAQSAAMLATLQGAISAVAFGLVVALGRRWRARRTSTHVAAGLVAGIVAYLASWTGLVVVGLGARVLGVSLAGGTGTVMTWVLAAWPGVLLALVVLAASALVAPAPNDPPR
jgi:hypothetical protein